MLIIKNLYSNLKIKIGHVFKKICIWPLFISLLFYSINGDMSIISGAVSHCPHTRAIHALYMKIQDLLNCQFINNLEHVHHDERAFCHGAISVFTMLKGIHLVKAILPQAWRAYNSNRDPYHVVKSLLSKHIKQKIFEEADNNDARVVAVLQGALRLQYPNTKQRMAHVLLNGGDKICLNFCKKAIIACIKSNIQQDYKHDNGNLIARVKKAKDIPVLLSIICNKNNMSYHALRMFFAGTFFSVLSAMLDFISQNGGKTFVRTFLLEMQETCSACTYCINDAYSKRSMLSAINGLLNIALQLWPENSRTTKKVLDDIMKTLRIIEQTILYTFVGVALSPHVYRGMQHTKYAIKIPPLLRDTKFALGCQTTVALHIARAVTLLIIIGHASLLGIASGHCSDNILWLWKRIVSSKPKTVPHFKTTVRSILDKHGVLSVDMHDIQFMISTILKSIKHHHS